MAPGLNSRFPALYEEAMRQTLALVTDRFTLEDFLRAQGWATKTL